MNVNLAKFGNTLIFRDRGKEAFSAFKPELEKLKPDEEICIDFDGVLTFSPSWGDEFLTPLYEEFGEKLTLANVQNNSSVVASMNTLKETRGMAVKILS